jgi:hypothetical protein
LEMFKSSYFADVSLNQRIRRLPTQMVSEHWRLKESDLSYISDHKNVVLG